MTRRRKARAVRYTLRNVPPALDRALRRRAKRLDKSLNEVALEALARGVGGEREIEEQWTRKSMFSMSHAKEVANDHLNAAWSRWYIKPR